MDGIKTGKIIYRKMGDSFVLDIAHPPKYCPQCQENGLVTKVKKFRLKTENILVLMCKNDQVNLPLDAPNPPCQASYNFGSISGSISSIKKRTKVLVLFSET
jgi:hypothetical protein